MISRDFASGVQFHDCEEKNTIIDSCTIVQIFQKENKKWYMTIGYNSDYYGNQRESEIKICPFCGRILD